MIKNIKWNQFPRAALDALYPRRCPVCGEIVTPKGGLICPSCLLRLSPVKSPVCQKCGKEVWSEEIEYCPDCVKHRRSFARGMALFNYTEEAAFALGCDTFIGAGSQAEYGRYEGSLNESVPAFPENGYGIAKLCAGQMTRIACKQKGMRHIWTRILSIYGPYDGENTMVMSTIYKLLNSEKPSCTKGEQMWDFLYSKDAALAMRLLGEKGTDGRTYCIGSGKARPLKEYIDIIGQNANKNVTIGYGDIPYGPLQVMYLCADITALREDTGFEPRYSFEDGIKETIEWCRTQNL